VSLGDALTMTQQIYKFFFQKPSVVTPKACFTPSPPESEHNESGLGNDGKNDSVSDLTLLPNIILNAGTNDLITSTINIKITTTTAKHCLDGMNNQSVEYFSKLKQSSINQSRKIFKFRLMVEMLSS
jgi:hypothetical protein